MREISKCKGTFWTSFIERGGAGVKSDPFKLNRSAKRAFIWRSIIFLCIILIFYTRSVVLLYFENSEKDILPESAVSPSYVGRNILGLVQTTTTAPTFPADQSTADRSAQLTSSGTSADSSSKNCTRAAIFEFPSDGLTRRQRQSGWILLHILVAFYCFWLLALICDNYFVPAIEQICATLSLQKDVVGATFMATATSSPELFMNCIGTFVTKGDIGVSTIVGSAVFNILAVPACCGFIVLGQSLQLDWWPITRDCLMYGVAILALLGTLYDGRVMWYEALLLVVGYFLYMAVMYYNDSMARTARRLISKYRRRYRPRPFREVTEFSPLISQRDSYISASKASIGAEICVESGRVAEKSTDSISKSLDSLSSDESDFADDPWQMNDSNAYEFICRWPLTFLLWLTIPDSRKHPGCKYITFLLSITWIGSISYLVAFVITIIGDTLNIPDSILGLTILAAGMSVPEAISSLIVTRQGQGAMGISNSIGSNTFDILLCLGIPWFVKAYFLSSNPENLWVEIESSGLTYSVVFLLATLLGLYITFVANRFILDWRVGLGCGLLYLTFLIFASLIELNVFFPVNLPTCEH